MRMSPLEGAWYAKDHVMCDFCRNKVSGEHYPHCTRNAPDAQNQLEQGWLDGRRGRECASDNPAYVVGWGRGESAYEEWFNGEPY